MAWLAKTIFFDPSKTQKNTVPAITAALNKNYYVKSSLKLFFFSLCQSFWTFLFQTIHRRTKEQPISLVVGFGHAFY